MILLHFFSFRHFQFRISHRLQMSQRGLFSYQRYLRCRVDRLNLSLHVPVCQRYLRQTLSRLSYCQRGPLQEQQLLLQQ